MATIALISFLVLGFVAWGTVAVIALYALGRSRRAQAAADDLQGDIDQARVEAADARQTAMDAMMAADGAVLALEKTVEQFQRLMTRHIDEDLGHMRELAGIVSRVMHIAGDNDRALLRQLQETQMRVAGVEAEHE